MPHTSRADQPPSLMPPSPPPTSGFTWMTDAEEKKFVNSITRTCMIVFNPMVENQFRQAALLTVTQCKCEAAFKALQEALSHQEAVSSAQRDHIRMEEMDGPRQEKKMKGNPKQS